MVVYEIRHPDYSDSQWMLYREPTYRLQKLNRGVLSSFLLFSKDTLLFCRMGTKGWKKVEKFLVVFNSDEFFYDFGIQIHGNYRTAGKGKLEFFQKTSGSVYRNPLDFKTMPRSHKPKEAELSRTFHAEFVSNLLIINIDYYRCCFHPAKQGYRSERKKDAFERGGLNLLREGFIRMVPDSNTDWIFFIQPGAARKVSKGRATGNCLFPWPG